jgi:hypothetical protein
MAARYIPGEVGEREEQEAFEVVIKSLEGKIKYMKTKGGRVRELIDRYMGKSTWWYEQLAETDCKFGARIDNLSKLQEFDNELTRMVAKDKDSYNKRYGMR